LQLLQAKNESLWGRTRSEQRQLFEESNYVNDANLAHAQYANPVYCFKTV